MLLWRSQNTKGTKFCAFAAVSFLTVHKMQIVFLDIATEQTPFHPTGCIIKGKKLKMAASTKNTYMKMDFISYFFSQKSSKIEGIWSTPCISGTQELKWGELPPALLISIRGLSPTFSLEETEVRPHGSLHLPPKGGEGAGAELCSLGTATWSMWVPLSSGYSRILILISHRMLKICL